MMEYTEGEIMNAALDLLARQPSGQLTTSELIKLLTHELSPIGHDTDIIAGRSDTYFSQKVRNLVSHRNASSGIVTQGYATYDNSTKPGTLTITEKGRLTRRGK